MALRIQDPLLDDTNALLAQVLTPVLKDNERVLFLCPAGEGAKIMQRMRVALSRQRRSMERKGKRFRRFSLHSSIHSETHGGKRFDAVICWQNVSTTDLLTQNLQEMISL